MLTENQKKQLIETIREVVAPSFIIVFGSFAKGTTHEKSDLDLAYYSDKQLSAYDRFTLARELTLIAECEVDLVDIKTNRYGFHDANILARKAHFYHG